MHEVNKCHVLPKRGMSFGDMKRGMYGEGGAATTRFSGWTEESGCVRLSFGCQRNVIMRGVELEALNGLDGYSGFRNKTDTL